MKHSDIMDKLIDPGTRSHVLKYMQYRICLWNQYRNQMSKWTSMLQEPPKFPCGVKKSLKSGSYIIIRVNACLKKTSYGLTWLQILNLIKTNNVTSRHPWTQKPATPCSWYLLHGHMKNKRMIGFLCKDKKENGYWKRAIRISLWGTDQWFRF